MDARLRGSTSARDHAPRCREKHRAHDLRRSPDAPPRLPRLRQDLEGRRKERGSNLPRPPLQGPRPRGRAGGRGHLRVSRRQKTRLIPALSFLWDDLAHAPKLKGGVKFADLLWPARVLFEMKSRSQKHGDQFFYSRSHIVPSASSGQIANRHHSSPSFRSCSSTWNFCCCSGPIFSKAKVSRYSRASAVMVKLASSFISATHSRSA